MKVRLHAKNKGHKLDGNMFYGQIISRKGTKASQYKILSDYGVIKEMVQWRYVYSIPTALSKTIKITGDIKKSVSLKQVGVLESKATHAQILCRCVVKPYGKRCSCIRYNVKCSVACYGLDPCCSNENEDPIAFKKYAMVPRGKVIEAIAGGVAGAGAGVKTRSASSI